MRDNFTSMNRITKKLAELSYGTRQDACLKPTYKFLMLMLFVMSRIDRTSKKLNSMQRARNRRSNFQVLDFRLMKINRAFLRATENYSEEMHLVTNFNIEGANYK